MNSYLKLNVLLFYFLFQSVSALAQQCYGPSGNIKMCLDVKDKNVLGQPLELCCEDPLTGFYRNGFCQTGNLDVGTHVVCAEVTNEFLEFSRSRGNDLISANKDFNFPGLKAGDKWCLCALRWSEALEAGVAPQINLKATHEKMLDYVPIEILQKYAID